MSAGKQKLRPWLEQMITKGEILGLCWLNDEKTKFRIPWKHGGKQDWSPDNSRIFMEWAKHTGKYREGVDDPNYPTWKTRLRCAFNKAPDIQEVPGESKLRCHEPYRVYILTQKKRKRATSCRNNVIEVRKTTDTGRAAKSECQAEEEEEAEAIFSDDCKFSPDTSQPFCSSRLLPTMVTEMESCSSPVRESETPDIQRLLDSSGEVLTEEQLLQSLGQFTEDVIIEFNGETMNDYMCQEDVLKLQMDDEMYSGLCEKTCCVASEVAPLLNDCRMKIEIFYCGHPVFEQEECDIKLGVHLDVDGFDDSVIESMPFIPSVVNQSYQKLYLPRCQGLLKSPRSEQEVDCVLMRTIAKGLFLWMDDNADIFAVRFCRGAIFHTSQIETKGEASKIQRNKKCVKIFSYQNSYKAEHEKYLRGQRLDAPDPTVYLTCCEKPSIDTVPDNVLICIKLTPLGLLQPESQGVIAQMQEKDLFYEAPTASDMEAETDQDADLTNGGPFVYQ